MKISNETLELLSSFASVNQNILIEEGNRLRTVSVKNNVFAQATVQEHFPRRIPIYNLSEFVEALGLLEDPEVEFGEKAVVMSDADGNSIKYAYADESILKYPKKEMQVPPGTNKGSFTASQFSRVLKSCRVLNLPRVSIVGDSEQGTICLVARDLNNQSDSANPNVFSIQVQGSCQESFEVNLERDLLTFHPGDYDFEIFKFNEKDSIVTLKHQSKDVSYVVAGSA